MHDSKGIFFATLSYLLLHAIEWPRFANVYLGVNFDGAFFPLPGACTTLPLYVAIPSIAYSCFRR